jgi:hypothetical protein
MPRPSKGRAWVRVLLWPLRLVRDVLLMFLMAMVRAFGPPYVPPNPERDRSAEVKVKENR